MEVLLATLAGKFEQMLLLSVEHALGGMPGQAVSAIREFGVTPARDLAISFSARPGTGLFRKLVACMVTWLEESVLSCGPRTDDRAADLQATALALREQQALLRFMEMNVPPVWPEQGYVGFLHELTMENETPAEYFYRRGRPEHKLTLLHLANQVALADLMRPRWEDRDAHEFYRAGRLQSMLDRELADKVFSLAVECPEADRLGAPLAYLQQDALDRLSDLWSILSIMYQLPRVPLTVQLWQELGDDKRTDLLLSGRERLARVLDLLYGLDVTNRELGLAGVALRVERPRLPAPGLLLDGLDQLTSGLDQMNVDLRVLAEKTTPRTPECWIERVHRVRMLLRRRAANRELQRERERGRRLALRSGDRHMRARK